MSKARFRRPQQQQQQQQRKRNQKKLPRFIAEAPWYANSSKHRKDEEEIKEEEEEAVDQLLHQRLSQEREKKKDTKDKLNQWYKKGKRNIIKQATKYRKGACKNCGAMDHTEKDCLERPRRKNAFLTGKNIAADREIQNIDMTHEQKHDHWSSFNPNNYSNVFQRFQILEEERKRILRKELNTEQLKKIGDEDKMNEEEETGDLGKFVIGGHDSKTRTSSRNLRIREDTAKYLMSLEENAPFYDPKTRSMRGNPDPTGKKNHFYKGDNAERFTGDYNSFKTLNDFAFEAQKRKKELQLAANPSMTELSHKEYLEKKKKMLTKTRENVLGMYSATEPTFGDSGHISEDDFVVENVDRFELFRKKKVLSRYNEDILENDHSEIFGSFWVDGKWGYACCKETKRGCRCSRKKRKFQKEGNDEFPHIEKKRKLD